MQFDKSLFLMCVTLALMVLMLLPSGTAGMSHMSSFFKASSGGAKFKHFVMMAFFFAVFGLAVYVGYENAMSIKSHEEAKHSH